MDPIRILKRAWHILWSYRALWIFGVVLALTTAGGFSGTNAANSSYNNNNNNNNFTIPNINTGDLPQALQEAFQSLVQASGTGAGVWIIIAIVLLVVILLAGIIYAFAHYISLTAVIRMVNGYEETGEKAGFRQGFRFGWSRTSWRLFLINLLISLPIYILVFFMLLLGIGIFLAIASGRMLLAIPASIGLIGLVFLVIFVLIIYSVLANLLSQFFWRVGAVEQLGVFASIRQGFNLVKRNWKQVGLMWLIMIGMQIAYGIAAFVIFFVTLPVLIITGLVGLIIAAIPTLIIAGLASLFMNGIAAWILGAMVGLPIFFLIAFSYLIFMGGLKEVYFSSVWTLTYRELKALENVSPAAPVAPSVPSEEIPAAQ
jgi:hypothetical protein